MVTSPAGCLPCCCMPQCTHVQAQARNLADAMQRSCAVVLGPVNLCATQHRLCLACAAFAWSCRARHSTAQHSTGSAWLTAGAQRWPGRGYARHPGLLYHMKRHAVLCNPACLPKLSCCCALLYAGMLLRHASGSATAVACAACASAALHSSSPAAWQGPAWLAMRAACPGSLLLRPECCQWYMSLYLLMLDFRQQQCLIRDCSLSTWHGPNGWAWGHPGPLAAACMYCSAQTSTW
jgi:hypothetical protein